jgi:hypothetical protein
LKNSRLLWGLSLEVFEIVFTGNPFISQPGLKVPQQGETSQLEANSTQGE